MDVDMEEKIRSVAKGFQIGKQVIEIRSQKGGHINDTFVLTCFGGEQFLLQRINTKVFHDAIALMRNVTLVTEWIRKKAIQENQDPDRSTLTVISARHGGETYRDFDGEIWRAYKYIRNSYCTEVLTDINAFHECAIVYGEFQRRLYDFPVSQLCETIPGFHDTQRRFCDFETAIRADVCNRASECEELIEFYLQKKYISELISKNSGLPLRVVHNDLKLSNVLFDRKSRKGICLIDLDTVMPGFVPFDYGEAIRSGASSAPEDERDETRIQCDMKRVEIFTRGFLESSREMFTEREISLLPEGALVMIYENGLRMLTDFLQGDVYYRTSYQDQNLNRAFFHKKMTEELEHNTPQIRAVISEYT